MIEESDLDGDEAARLRELVAAADPAGLAARSPLTGQGADLYQHELEVRSGDSSHRIVVSGTRPPAQLQPLISYLEERAAATRNDARLPRAE